MSRDHLFKRLRQQLTSLVNDVFPKSEKAMVIGFPNVESSAIATANYLAERYALPVSYVVSEALADDPRALLRANVEILYKDGSLKNQIRYFKALLSTKYLFLTHGIFITRFSKKQVVTNIWHGILYKKIGVLIGGRPMPANVSVGTSPLTKKMFAAAFGVAEETVFISGYPRNDILLQAKNKKQQILKQISPSLLRFDQILIWLPTFRKHADSNGRHDGTETGNPFYIPDFDIERFNALLKAQNSFCFVKPHPMAVKYADQEELSQIRFIDDAWISSHGLTLYHLLGCTDALISDVSSVVIDYLLMDQPILCVSLDFEAYKQTRGFYFEDIENWLPGEVIQDQESFFKKLEVLLQQKDDGAAERRTRLKDAFFSHHDARSTERLLNHVFKL